MSSCRRFLSTAAIHSAMAVNTTAPAPTAAADVQKRRVSDMADEVYDAVAMRNSQSVKEAGRAVPNNSLKTMISKK